MIHCTKNEVWPNPQSIERSSCFTTWLWLLLVLVIIFSDLPLFLEPLLFVAFFSIFYWFAVVSYFHCSYDNHYCHCSHYYLCPFFLFNFFVSRIKGSRLENHFFFLPVCFFVLFLPLKSQGKNLQPHYFFLVLKKITV